jgi:hypothetical protein
MDECEIRDCRATGAAGGFVYNFEIPDKIYIPPTRGIGGAIASFGSHLSVINCTFAHNVANGPNGKGKPDPYPGEAGFGGAIWATNSVTDFDNCRFSQNSARSGEVTTVDNTRPSAGGAVHTTGNTVFIAHKSHFASNFVFLGNGGALSLGSTSRVSSCTFISNVSTGQTFYPYYFVAPQNYGGAIFTDGEVSATECVFFKNSMHGASARAGSRPFTDLPAEPGFGGALASLGRVVSLTNCTFFLNSAIGGDGLFWSGTNYSPYGRGGALYAGSNTMVTLVHSSFSSNWVGRSTYPSTTSVPLGSAVFVDTNAALNIQASIVGQHSTAPAVFGSVADLGFNLSADGTPQFSESSSANNIDPLFIYPDRNAAALLELQAGSPAIDRVPLQLSLVDGRGFPRPLRGSDSGAIEMEAPFAAIATATTEGVIEFRLGLFGHSLKVEATTDFVAWREAGFTETDSRGEQVFRPALNEALTFYRFKAN